MAPKKTAPAPAPSQTVRTIIDGNKIITEVTSYSRKDKDQALRRLGAPVVGNTNRVEKAKGHGVPFQGTSKYARARARKRAEKEKEKQKEKEREQDKGKGNEKVKDEGQGVAAVKLEAAEDE